ncbi:methyltransferase family protein [Ilumatobacter fluminis]|uniref:Methyltransferase family protein n=1 Tax=Ilumatobacter fluminis TaxID=467091 RepID=A0A4R7I1A2_9ACTN|nr:class I SAM-dependent methyltransferase [Ilumatobacter fluminis]TDT17337.1 methyltransferase family protein [Ilumatobacter fluminis]
MHAARTAAQPLEPAARIRELELLEQEWKRGPRRNDRINAHIRAVLAAAGLSAGDVLEIGAREHPRTDVFAASAWNYSVMDIEAGSSSVPVVVGDITSCPELPDESFDVAVSVDVFEHVNRPWLAAEEISRLLRPGGISYTSTLFAWRYHPVPIDFWRFTPDCLDFLFADLDRVDSGFDTTERRRDIRGRGRRDQVPIDGLGGFRENWRVFHVGRKP